MADDGELPGPGRLIAGRYRVVSLLGRGGMGAVFDAIDTTTSRAVALKWMLPHAAQSADAVSRFLLEARAAARIEHPNVIGVIDVGVDGGSPFLVIERLRGESLAERLASGRLSVALALDVLIPACRGVAEVHREGVVHRDLKPENIFLCEARDDGPPQPKILDFGIAKLREPEGDEPITRSRVALGTPRYMSPQQLGAPREVDARFDVYAMGVVLYQTLTGQLPYEGAGLLELVAKIAEGSPIPVCALAPDVPPALELTVMRAMHARVEVRHATMDELASELEAIRASILGDGPAPLAPAAAAIASIARAPAPFDLTVPEDGATPLASHLPEPARTQASQPSHASEHPRASPERRRSRSDERPSPARRRSPEPPAPGSRAIVLLAIALGVVGLCAAAVAVGWAAWPRDPRVPATASPSRLHPQIDLTFQGACAPRFDGTISVTHPRPSQLLVVSRSGGRLQGSILIDAGSASMSGRIPLTESNYLETRMSLTLQVAEHPIWGSYRDVRPNEAAWPIRGALEVRRFELDRGAVDVTFDGVVLAHLGGIAPCGIDGRLQTFGLTMGE